MSSSYQKASLRWHSNVYTVTDKGVQNDHSKHQGLDLSSRGCDKRIGSQRRESQFFLVLVPAERLLRRRNRLSWHPVRPFTIRGG